MFDVALIRELATIPIATVAMFLIYRLATNHMNTLAAAVEKLADAIGELKDWMRKDKNDDN